MRKKSAARIFHTSGLPAFRAGWKISRLRILLAIASFLCLDARAGRTVLSLDGTWQIADGKMDARPAVFERTAPVPGLVSLATPAFDAPGPVITNQIGLPQKDPKRDAFWYRRTFTIDAAIPAVAKLKVAKAMFGTRVFLNGILLGDHMPNFTPGYFDARPALKTGLNEILIWVGADRDALGQAYPNGFDLEKRRYIPGIFDSVQLILSGTPHFLTVQAAPDIAGKTLRVQAVLRNDGKAAKAPVQFVVREAKSGKVAGRFTSEPVDLAQGAETTVDVRIPLPACRLWSPEDPFLYTLEADSGADSYQTRFGMREFKFDPATGCAMLNGRPYFMRGSNITLYRFFEDSECGDLPWDKKWVRRLHQRVKDMHWNCLRYCIGFPPEAWYDMADEEGVLIEDEFPIWHMDNDLERKTWPAKLKADEIAREYTEWMKERWNHPCVVIWDAQNETVTPETGNAIQQVRSLDLSNRPWDNGWSPAQAPGDMFESHPYHWQNPGFKLADLATADPVPHGNALPNAGNAIVINEYGWLWLNREGAMLPATEQVYKNLLGANSTTAQRFHLQATYLAADTEFWRGHRSAAAIMHFTMLGYSRSDGTSDNWTKGGVARLVWEPEFYKYVRDAFAPVGMMIDYWKNRVFAETRTSVPVVLINDLYQPWSGRVTLSVKHGGHVLASTKQDAHIEALGTTKIVFDITCPKQAGPCVMEAELRGADGQPVHSVRDIKIVQRPVTGLEYQKPVTASSTYAPEFRPENAVDGDFETYWSSEFKDPAWLAVDLGETKKISRVTIRWESAFAKSFSIQVSADGQAWTDVYKTDDGKGGVSEIKFTPVEARHVRLNCTKRGTQWGNAVYEMQIFQ